MPSIELGPTRPIGAVETTPATALPTIHDTKASTGGNLAAAGTNAAPASGLASDLAAGAAPVDANRVALIRQALASGTYPVIPARIADAAIAAGYLLRTKA